MFRAPTAANFPFCPPKIGSFFWGGGVSLKLIFHWNPNIFVGAHTKFKNFTKDQQPISHFVCPKLAFLGG